MKVRIHSHRIPWGEIRAIIVLILFCSILIAAAFGWGMIYENRRNENVLKIAQQNERKITDMAGMIEESRAQQPKISSKLKVESSKR